MTTEDGLDADPTSEEVDAHLALRDGAHVARLMPLLKLAVKTYFRSEVRGMERVPEGGALLVSNHSGGLMAMDVPIIAVAFFDTFGTERPLYVLAHDMLFLGGGKDLFSKVGFAPAHRRFAAELLRRGAATIVFPGGDHEVFRPSWQGTTVDFAGRRGYVRTALEAGVPIVPIVSLGGQEQYFVLGRGERLAKLLRLDKAIRLKHVPITFGFPFGLSIGIPPNLPLPTKIVTQVLEPIDIRAEFGDEPDIDAVDAEIRSRMQAALDELARKRRFPVLG